MLFFPCSLEVLTMNTKNCFNCGSKMNPEYNCPTCNGWDEEVSNKPENVPDYVPDQYKHKLFAMTMGVNGTERTEDVPSSDSSLLPFLTRTNMSTMKALPNKLDMIDRVCRTCGIMQTIEVIQGNTPTCNHCHSTKLEHIPEDEEYFKPKIERDLGIVDSEYDHKRFLEHLENTRRLGAQTSKEPEIDEHGEVIGTIVHLDFYGVKDIPNQVATAKAIARGKPCPTGCKREYDMFGNEHVCIVAEEKNTFLPKGYSSWEDYKMIQSYLNIWCTTPPTQFQRNVCKKHLNVDPIGFTERQLTKHMKAYFWAKKTGNTELMEHKANIIKSNHEPVDNSLIWNIDETYKPFAKRKDYDPVNLDELDGWDSKNQQATGFGEADLFSNVKYPTFVPNKFSRYDLKNDLLLTSRITGARKPLGKWELNSDGEPVFTKSSPLS